MEKVWIFKDEFNVCVLFLNSSYELDNGQIFSEAGELKTIGDQQAVVKSGAYSFVGADGITYWVTYTADENGFHPIIGVFCALKKKLK